MRKATFGRAVERSGQRTCQTRVSRISGDDTREVLHRWRLAQPTAERLLA